jgi:hypothetical protein
VHLFSTSPIERALHATSNPNRYLAALSLGDVNLFVFTALRA